MLGSDIAVQGNSIGAHDTSVTNEIGTVNFSDSDSDNSQAFLPAGSAFVSSLAGFPTRRRAR